MEFGPHGTALASAAGFVGGAIPNYILNRRWAWSGTRQRSRRTELVLYFAVALSSFAVATVVTAAAQRGARHLSADRGWSVVLAAVAYLGVSGVFFVVKFVLYDRLVFSAARGGRRAAPPTTS